MAIPKVNLKKIRRASGIIYQLDFRVNGKRLRESVGSDKRQADLIRLQRVNDIVNGKFNLPGATKVKISLDSLAGEYTKEKKRTTRSATQKRYKNYIDPFVGFFKDYFPVLAADISLVEMKHVNEFLDQVTDTSNKDTPSWSARTTNDCIKVLRSMFRFAQDNGYLNHNPLAKVKPFRETSSGKVDYFDEKQLEQIWAALDPHWVDSLKFIAHTGLRKGELINLRWTSVNLTSGNESITVESCDEWETKTGKSRVVPLNDVALEIVNRQKGKNKEFVFTSKEGHQIHPDKIYHALTHALAEIGIEGDVHKLRHTFASHLAMKNIDLGSIRDLLGHTDIATTQRYAHLAPEHLRRAVDVLSASRGIPVAKS